MARLIREDTGEAFELATDRVLIGRQSPSRSVIPDVSILHDDFVSREHALVHRRDEGYEIENLSQSGGTFVNDTKRNFHHLRHGDRILVGHTALLFEDAPEVAGADANPDAPADAAPAGASPDAAGDGRGESGPPCEPTSVTFVGDDVEVVQRVDSDRLHAAGELFREELLRSKDHSDADRIQALFRITTEINGTLKEEEIYEKGMALIRDLIPVGRGAILIKDPENGELDPVVTCGDGNDEGLFMSKGVVDEVLGKGVAFLAADASANELLRRRMSVFMKRIKSVMCAPLGSGGEVFGLCYVDSVSMETQYTESDLLHLGIFCNILSRAVLSARTARRAEEQALLTRNLERYFSPKVIRELSKGDLDLGGKELEVSVLFTDVRKFSDIARHLSPSELLDVLNEHFSLVADIIIEFEGTIDKYIGDSVMAFWGAPAPVEHAPMRCVLASIEIQRQMKKRKEEIRRAGGAPLSIGIGINTGLALAGNIGSPKRMDYSIVSDAVNTAERLCSLATPDQILVSPATRAKVADLISANYHPPREVKGGQQLDSYEVIWE